ncbi:hypothetical protein ACQP00_33115 [Dactylosporangium sp. CS-047395]|uniref:hypothetical protein n=1 Tax=Dactylosporangium sp. CS-047395 TaxID=3239936 RepID=UPI003D900176
MMELIRELSAGDPARVEAAWREIDENIQHQGRLFPEAVDAVPLLVEAAARAVVDRALLVVWVGMLADPMHSYGDALPAVQAALKAVAVPLVALVDDGDEQVCAAALYLMMQVGAVPGERVAAMWGGARDPELRVALLFTLALAPEVMRAALGDEEPAVRLAAALALQRSGSALPDDVPADIVDERIALPYQWRAQAEPVVELLLNAPPALQERLLRERPELWAMEELFRRDRGARFRLVPLLGPLLADPATRDEALEVLGKSGQAAGLVRAELAALAPDFPAAARTLTRLDGVPESSTPAVVARVAVGELRTVATDRDRHRRERLDAARALWAATGETEIPAAVASECLDNRTLAPDALDLARLADARRLRGAIGAWLGDDGLPGVAAARAALAFGTPAERLLPGLLRCVAGGSHRPAFAAVELLAELGDASVTPRLLELAGRDRALVTAGRDGDIAWHDDELRDRLRAAAADIDRRRRV